MAKLIDGLSSTAIKSQLNLFDLPPTQVVVENTSWRELQLRNACNNQGPYEFYVSPDPQMLNLTKNYLFVEMKITKENGQDLIHTQGDPNIDPLVGPINLIGKTLIKQLKVSLNGVEVFDSGDKYAYRAYLETELNYGSDAKTSHIQAAIYNRDTPSDHIDSDQNTGLTSRAQHFRTSAAVQMIAPLHCDLFSQNKYMLNNVDLRVTVYRNPDAFCLMSPNAAQRYKIHVQNMKWYVQTVEVSKSMSLALERIMMKHTAKYPIRRVEMRTMHVAAGRRQTPQNAVFNGQIPRRIVLGCVDADAYQGVYGKSPFNFKGAEYEINEVSVVAAGKTYPQKPLTLDFANNRYVEAFIQLFEGLGISDDNKGNGVTLKSYKNGTCLFAFDLSPDHDDGNHWDLVRDGSTAINIKFGQAVPAGGIEVIMYAEFDNLITIDHDRHTYIDYRA